MAINIYITLVEVLCLKKNKNLIISKEAVQTENIVVDQDVGSSGHMSTNFKVNLTDNDNCK